MARGRAPGPLTTSRDPIAVAASIAGRSSSPCSLPIVFEAMRRHVDDRDPS